MRTNRMMIAMLAVAVALTSCKNDEDPVIPNTSHTHSGTLRTAFNFYYGSTAFNTATTYQDDMGSDIRIDKARFYVSCTQAFDMGGTMIADYTDKYLLVDAANASNDFELGIVNEHYVHDIRYNIGLDSLTNHTDPMTAPAPLNDATMHWGWNAAAGYKFLVLEGVVDTTGSGDFGPFVYHVATDPLRRWVSTSVHADITDGGTTTVLLKVNLHQILSGVDVRNDRDTHTGNNPVLANLLMDNSMTAITKQ